MYDSRRKEKLEKISIYKSYFDALLVLPDNELRHAMCLISDEFGLICNRTYDRSTEVHNAQIKRVKDDALLSVGAKKILVNIIGNMFEDVTSYWQKADQNAINRRGK